jgi:hypothetical protein
MKSFSFVIVLATFASHAIAQTYSIDKSVIAGGGALNSTGGVYSLSGTIGQPDASGPLSGGTYSVVGGFWALPVAVQTTGGPLLTIVPAAAAHATIAWSPSTPGFLLQEALSLSSTNWLDSASGATNPVIVPASIPAKFYRLRKP